MFVISVPDRRTRRQTRRQKGAQAAYGSRPGRPCPCRPAASPSPSRCIRAQPPPRPNAPLCTPDSWPAPWPARGQPGTAASRPSGLHCLHGCLRGVAACISRGIGPSITGLYCAPFCCCTKPKHCRTILNCSIAVL